MFCATLQNSARRQSVCIAGWLLLGLCAVAPAFAQETVWKPSSETACQLHGWSIDIDPKGTNVRAAPSAKARVVGKLPAYVVTGGGLSGGYGIEFDIIGSHNGWLKITGAKDDPDRSGKPPRSTYAGTGWISGNLVWFAVQSRLGYAEPDSSSARLLDLMYGNWLAERAKIERVVACQGKWALLDFRLLDPTDNLIPLPKAQRERGRAWFRGICGAQETTCDGVVPDDKPEPSPTQQQP